MRLVYLARGALAALASATALGLAVASPHVPPYERFYKEGDADQVAAGKLLLGELSCTSCHAASDAEALLLSQKQPPVLDEISQRAKPDYLAKFLVNPPTIKPGTTMPSVLHGLSGEEAAKQAELLAHFLASLNPAGPQQSFAAIAGRTRGELLYNTVGCAQCHGSRKEGATSDGFELTFTQPVDSQAASDVKSYNLQTYTYLDQSDYGSPEVDHTKPTITKAEVSADNKTVRHFVDKLQRGHIHELQINVKNEAGLPLLHNTGYYTLNNIP
jgi:mono/diheme cytochrome c family protein